jgi:PAS domain S-box-containing protein
MDEDRSRGPINGEFCFIDEFYSRLIVDNLNQALTVLDLSGRILYQSPSSQHLLGYQRAISVGGDWTAIVHPDDLATVRDQIDLCSTLGEHCNFSARVRTEDRDWQLVTVDAFVSSAVGTERRIICTWQLANDVTILQSQLESVRQEAAKLKSAFIGNLSHEIRTPLNLILLHSELLYESIPELSSEIRSSLETIASAVTRLSSTIHMLLDLSQIQSGIFRIQPQQVDLQNLIERQIAAIESTAERKGIRVLFRRLAINIQIVLDEYCFSHALASILDNAVKFTERGYVEISLSHPSPNMVSIQIEDTGRGMSKEFLKNMWLPLSQEGADGIRAHRGIGLGLTLTKQYLDRINAQINVSSIPGRGSKFTIDFEIDSAECLPAVK